MTKTHNKNRVRYLLAAAIAAALGVYGLALYFFPLQSSYKSLAAGFLLIFFFLSVIFLTPRLIRVTNKNLHKAAAAKGKKLSRGQLALFWGCGLIGMILSYPIRERFLTKDLSHIGIEKGVVSIRKNCTSIHSNTTELAVPDETKFPVVANTSPAAETPKYMLAMSKAKNEYITKKQNAEKLNTFDKIQNSMQTKEILKIEKQSEMRGFLQDYCTYIGIQNEETRKFITEIYTTEYNYPITYPEKAQKIKHDYEVYTKYLNATEAYFQTQSYIIDVFHSLLDFINETKSDQTHTKNGLYFKKSIYRDYMKQYLKIITDATAKETEAKSRLVEAEKELKKK